MPADRSTRELRRQVENAIDKTLEQRDKILVTYKQMGKRTTLSKIVTETAWHVTEISVILKILELKLIDYVESPKVSDKRPVKTGRYISNNPPNNACYLLRVFLAKGNRDAISGDLLEEYGTEILPKYGVRRAQFWFWFQTVRTIATQNPVCRWVLVYGISRVGEWLVRQIGL